VLLGSVGGVRAALRLLEAVAELLLGSAAGWKAAKGFLAAGLEVLLESSTVSPSLDESEIPKSPLRDEATSLVLRVEVMASGSEMVGSLVDDVKPSP